MGARDVLLVWCFGSPEEAARAETNILAALGPAWNLQRATHSWHRVEPAR